MNFDQLTSRQKIVLGLTAGLAILLLLAFILFISLAVAWTMSMGVIGIGLMILAVYAFIDKSIRNVISVPVHIMAMWVLRLYSWIDPQGAFDGHLLMRERNLELMRENLQTIRSGIHKLEESIRNFEEQDERALVAIEAAEAEGDEATLVKEGLGIATRKELLREQRSQLETYQALELEKLTELQAEELEIVALRTEGELAATRMETAKTMANLLESMNPVTRLTDSKVARLALQNMKARANNSMGTIGAHAHGSQTGSGDKKGHTAWGRHLALNALRTAREARQTASSPEGPVPTGNKPEVTEESPRAASATSSGGNSRKAKKDAAQRAAAAEAAKAAAGGNPTAPKRL